MMAPLLTLKLEIGNQSLFNFKEKITNHRVVGLPVVVESDLVKSPTAGLPPDVLLNNLDNALQCIVGENMTEKQTNVKEYSMFYIKWTPTLVLYLISEITRTCRSSSLCFLPTTYTEVWSQISGSNDRNSRERKRVEPECCLTFILIASYVRGWVFCFCKHMDNIQSTQITSAPMWLSAKA